MADRCRIACTLISEFARKVADVGAAHKEKKIFPDNLYVFSRPISTPLTRKKGWKKKHYLKGQAARSELAYTQTRRRGR